MSGEDVAVVVSSLFGTGGVGFALRYLLNAAREAGRSEAYKEHTLETLASKDNEIAALKGEVAALKALLARGSS